MWVERVGRTFFSKAQDVHKKSISDSYNDKLGCRKETLANQTLKVLACLDLKDSWQAKVQTIMCQYERITWITQPLRISSRESILHWRLLPNICWACLARGGLRTLRAHIKFFIHEIHIYLNFTFKFDLINLTSLNIHWNHVRLSWYLHLK